MSNNEIRQHILQARLQLSATEQQEAAITITTNVINLECFQKSEHIAVYMPHDNEVNTQALVDTIWEQNKKCYLPVMTQQQHLAFAVYNEDTILNEQQFGILEPKYQQLVEPQDMDLVITPLVAFNTRCMRLGWGKGFYDKTFAFLNTKPRPNKPQLLGLAYALQEIEFEVNDWDVALNTVVTEEQIFTLETA